MKPNLKIVLNISALAILVFAAILFFQDLGFFATLSVKTGQKPTPIATPSIQNVLVQDNQAELSQQTLSQNYRALLPKKSENPLGSGEEVSFTQAKKKISFPIPLPEGEKIKQVWIRTNPENPLQQSIAIRFKRDILLIVDVSQNEAPTNWDKVIEFMPEFKKIEVNGISGMGTDPGVTEVQGQPYSYPGSVAWWLDGLDVTLYSDTLPLEELLNIARTVQSENALLVPIGTITSATDTPIPSPTITTMPLSTESVLIEETVTPTP